MVTAGILFQGIFAAVTLGVVSYVLFRFSKPIYSEMKFYKQNKWNLKEDSGEYVFLAYELGKIFQFLPIGFLKFTLLFMFVSLFIFMFFGLMFMFFGLLYNLFV